MGAYRNSPVIGDGGIQTQPGDNARLVNYTMEIMQWDKPDRNDIQALDDRLFKYLQYCMDNDIKPGNMMCYLAMGINRKIAHEWENGTMGTPAHSDIIKKAKAICAGYRELLMQNGKINPVTGIFWQKNYDGLKDVQDVILTPNNPAGDLLSHDEIVQKYLPDGNE